MNVTSITQLRTPKEAAERLGISQRWLARGRSEGFGPAYVALGYRTVRYSERSLQEWIDGHMRRSSSEAATA